MTDEQRQFVLNSMSKVSADLFDKSDYEKVRLSEQSAVEIVNKAFGLFPRKDAGDFVEPLNTDKSEEISLLQKYEDLLKIGSKKRMRVAKEMPLDERVNIWKIQLAYHLATGKFSKSQNDFILKMLTELSPETFTSRLNLTEEEESKAEKLLLSSILSVFTKQEGYAVFMTIGIQKYIKDVQIVSNNLAPTCDCNWSCPGQGEWCTGGGCKSSEIGDCGPYGTTRCHSLCE